MPKSPSILLDTNVLKASVDTQLAFLPDTQTFDWGGEQVSLKIHQPVYVNQNVKLLIKGRPSQFDDTLALRFIAALAKEGKIRLLTHQEVVFELMRLPRANGGQRFYDAPIENVQGPFQYGRIVIDHTKHDYQYEFLSKVDHPRFKELQRACGAYQGQHKPLNRNQLLDAFHVLCAESASAEYFLTMDGKLARVLQHGKKKKTNLNFVSPKELLIALVARRPTWLWSIWKERKRLLKSGRQLDAYIQDASEEFFKGKRK